MRWYHWLIVLLVGDLALLYLTGTGLVTVEIVGPLLALQLVVLNWILVVWLLRFVARWFRSGL